MLFRSSRLWLEEEGEQESMLQDEAQPEDCLLRRWMGTLLDKLSEEQRRALVLHHVMGMSVPELAQELAVPLETIRSRLRLGKAHLRELFFSQVDLEAALP